MANQTPKRPFRLVTDGSGHSDGYGGFAAILTVPGEADVIHRVFGGSTHSSTDRMEFAALLSGLQYCTERLPSGWLSERLPGDRWPLHWWSDRESLVKSAQGLYKRKAAPDLWRSFTYFEEIFEIACAHITIENYDPESECPWLVEADSLASSLRIVMASAGESFKSVALSKAAIDYGSC